VNADVRNAPQLIAYADRLAGDLDGLAGLLDGPLRAAFGGVHILPFFVPIDGSDAGFDPSDHTTVDPRLGDWSTVQRVASGRDVMADLIVNHMSADSQQFRDWIADPDTSPHDGMFLTYERVYPDGATEAELLRIFRPRPGLPFTVYVDGTRRPRLVWTTFTSTQIDLDLTADATWTYLMSILDRFQSAGVSVVRLDAIGYAAKKPGTTSFMIPETYDIIERLKAESRRRGMETLVEVHGHYLEQIAVAQRVDRVYDFALPPLVLDALFRGTTAALKRWIDIRPTNCVTVLDTHDGIGVVDVEDLLEPAEISDLIAGIHERSGGASERATGYSSSNLDVYQVNCTYYDALGRDDDRYVLARLTQLLLPGVPQIYYVGLLAGENDVALLDETGVGRDINRHRYSAAEVESALARPVVREILALLEWRAAHPAFEGDFDVLPAHDHQLAVRWAHGEHHVDATLDFAAGTYTLDSSVGSLTS
jgi:sucrose phosphorylase